MRTVTIKDSVYKIVNEQAKEIFSLSLFVLYELKIYDQAKPIETFEHLNICLENGNNIGIFVDRFDNIIDSNEDKKCIVWSIQDFTEYPHQTHKVNEEQARECLRDMIRHHDASFGVCWNDVSYYIEQYGTEK